MKTNTTEKVSLCPSARPTLNSSVVFGVVGGTVDLPRVVYLKQTLDVTEELISKVHPVTPAEVFRSASPCETNNCQHFDGTNCRLASRVAKQLPVVTSQLPSCPIRRDCQWWAQEGSVACFRCPQIVTDNYSPSSLMKEVSLPTNL